MMSSFPFKGRFAHLLLVALAACAVQGIYLATTAKDPVHTLPLLDAGTYVRQAQDIVDGQGDNGRPFWQPPLYPYALAAVVKVSGTDAIGLRNAQILLHVLTALLTAVIATRLACRRTGLIAGLTASVYGPLLFFSGQPASNVPFPRRSIFSPSGF